ncbi:helix-turn-helix transcriptional regulator [Streptomyces sp. SAI-229]|uniref:helix-turn-helix transcriptional regulator n=1 Tax=Streptomyces sp. SAI-229 TaxID=3377731 RepID=UPI003C7E1F8E
MPRPMPSALVGRDRERAEIDELLTRAAAGEGGALVLRGEPGIGKTALLDYAAIRAAGALVLRTTGVERESTLAFSGLYGLVTPLADMLLAMPPARSATLAAVTGLSETSEATVPDRFRVATQLMMLLASAAERRPLLILVDDAQWLDRPSSDAVLFAARRLQAEAVAVLIAVRDGDPVDFPTSGLDELLVEGLPEPEADALLARGGRDLAPAVRTRLLAEACGNPLALLEIPGSLSREQLRGDAPLPETIPLSPRIRRMFHDRIGRLPEATRTALVLAAADNTGDASVVLRAAAALGLPGDSLDAAENAALIQTHGGGIAFRHPLVRAAVYDGATLSRRRAAHTALARVLPGEENADRRVWHQALAAIEHDEGIATALEESARRATRRAAHAPAAAALLRSAGLSTDGGRRTRRLTAAAEALWAAGQTDPARSTAARALPLAEGEQAARLLRLSGVIEARAGHLRNAYDQLLEAAEAGEDPSDTLETLIEAAGAAFFLGDAGRLAVLAGHTAAIVPGTARDRLIAYLVRGHAKLLAGAYEEARDLLDGAAEQAGKADDPRALIWAARAKSVAHGTGAGLEHADRAVRLTRRRGLISLLPLALAQQSADLIGVGAYDLAYATAEEGERLATELGQGRATHLNHKAMVEAVHGRYDEARAHAEEVLLLTQRNGSAYHAALARWAIGIAELGAGRPAQAVERLLTVTAVGSPGFNPVVGFAAMPDAVEALVRAGRSDEAVSLTHTFAVWAEAAPTDARRALLARCRAMLDDRSAQSHHEHALELVTALPPWERARCELLYGEWLRRRRRGRQARTHLRTAHELFTGIGATPLAERAAAELRAAGETAVRSEPGAVDRLTPQELQIATLVAQGLTNPEIADQLFLSPRTIDYHLHKVFTKLQLTSRTQLIRNGLPQPANPFS